MRSTYIVFPAANEVAVATEEVGSPGPGEILCQSLVSLISAGTETHCLRGIFDPGTNWADWVRFPFRPGYSMVARVVAVGQGVTGPSEGTRVALSAPHQQFVRMDASRAIAIPDRISDEEAAWLSLSIITQLAVRRAALQLGESVGVVGLGPLGQLIVQYMRANGARHIVAIDRLPSRLDIARTHGATHALQGDAADLGDDVAALTGGAMLDVVFDVTGHYAVLAQCIPLVRRLGRVVLVGDTPLPTQQCLGPGVVSNSVAILGIHANMAPSVPSEYNPWTRAAMGSLFFDYCLQGRMNVADLVTHRYQPGSAASVYAALLADRSSSLGVLFDWTMR